MACVPTSISCGSLLALGIKQRDHVGWREHRQQESGDTDDRGVQHGHAQRPQHSVIISRPVVVADDRLSTLVEPEHGHGNEQRDRVHDAHDRDREIAAVAAELIEEDGVRNARRHLHRKHGRAGGRDGRTQCSTAAGNVACVELEQALAPHEIAENPHGGDGLGQHGRGSGSSHPPAQHKQEERVEHGVEQRADQQRHHGDARIAFAADHRIEPEPERLENRAGDDDLQVFPRVRLAGIAGTHGPQQGIQQRQSDGSQQNGHQQQEHQRVPEHVLGLVASPLTQANGNQRRGPNPTNMLKAIKISMKGKARVVPAIPSVPIARPTNTRSTML